MAGSCQYGIEPSCSIKGMEFHSAEWNCFVAICGWHNSNQNLST